MVVSVGVVALCDDSLCLSLHAMTEPGIEAYHMEALRRQRSADRRHRSQTTNAQDGNADANAGSNKVELVYVLQLLLLIVSVT